MRQELELGGIGVPQFVSRVRLRGPFFSVSSRVLAFSYSCGSRLLASVCLGRPMRQPWACTSRRSQSTHTVMPVSRCRCVRSRAMLQTVNTYPKARGPRRSARQSCRRYASVTTGGRPALGRSVSERIPRCRQRLRMLATLLRLSPVTRAMVVARSPASERSRQMARLLTRADGPWSRSRMSRCRCHEVSRTSCCRMPDPPAGPLCPYQRNNRHIHKNFVVPTYPLVTIANMCGFRRVSHMITVFRQRTGLTPAKFRRTSG